MVVSDSVSNGVGDDGMIINCVLKSASLELELIIVMLVCGSKIEKVISV